MNESQTRAELIDKRLLQSSWNIQNHSQVIKEFSVDGLFVDYVLLAKDGKPLAVVDGLPSKRGTKIIRRLYL